MPTNHAPVAWLKIVVIGMLAALALATRLPAPWNTEITNDEMYHIKSWRTRYRTDDVMPIFLRRLDETNRFSTAQKEKLKHLYHTSPLFQRLLCIKSDYGSFGFSTLAETIEFLSESNLTAVRVPSVLFSLGSIVLAYLLGKALMDEALGLWLAAFLTVGMLPQVYAGLGRPHTMTQFGVMAVIYALVLEQRQHRPSPSRFLIVALFAQTAHFTGWAVVGTLVASELVRRYLSGTSLAVLFRQTWWYAALSVMLLGVICVVGMGTSFISANVAYPGVYTLFSNFCLASPFGHLARLGEPWMWLSGLVWVGLILNGVRVLFAEESGWRGFRWPFLITLVVSLSVPLVASNGVRHMLIYGVMPTIISALGARDMFRTQSAALAGVAVVLVALAPLSLTGSDYRYQFILTYDVRYSKVANRLASEMKPGDVWISWPYFAACPLYPYRALPDPIMALTRDEFLEAVHHRPADHACFVLMARTDENIDPVLKQAPLRVEYANGTVLLKLPPAPAAAPAQTQEPETTR
jgi:hypothetical protein